MILHSTTQIQPGSAAALLQNSRYPRSTEEASHMFVQHDRLALREMARYA